jgi:hypothetical protein
MPIFVFIEAAVKADEIVFVLDRHSTSNRQYTTRLKHISSQPRAVQSVAFGGPVQLSKMCGRTGVKSIDKNAVPIA